MNQDVFFNQENSTSSKREDTAMGFGLEYRCSKCKKEHSASLYEGFDGDTCKKR